MDEIVTVSLLRIQVGVKSFVHQTEILSSKKKAYSELAKRVNNVKIDIDNARTALDNLRAEREAEGKFECLLAYCIHFIIIHYM